MVQKPGPMLDDYAEHIRQGRVYVIDVDGVPAALLVLIPEDDAMLLDNVAVSPAARGTGLGRQLIQFAERAALAAGYKTIRLYTHVTMTENIELYRRNGFVETHRLVQKGLSRVFMSKRLW
jgi:ribosomal protein S18 acetylase RimI-like enzyme